MAGVHFKDKAVMLIRDAIWKDLEFNELEESLIRSKLFQRLHYIRQLGTAYQVYPCAMHTRFEHSLGTYFVTKKIIEVIEKAKGFEFDQEDKELIPILALLHDITHIPFGHVLEDDFKLFSQHDDVSRYSIFLEKSEIKNILGNELTGRIIKIISTKDPFELGRPYQLEIVKNTISADLLDYTIRDCYFTGLKREYDDRILKSFNIHKANFDKKPHLFVEITDGKGALQRDVITEIDHLLRIRYMLAERVYYYHTKVAADAMIGRAITDLKLNQNFFNDKGDEDIINFFIKGNHNVKTTKLLGLLFKERKIYHRAYMISRDKVSNLTKFIKDYQNKGKIQLVEDELLKKHKNARKGDLLLLCHGEKMNMKEVKVLIKDEEGNMIPLINFPKAKNVSTINEDHLNLWKFYVFAKKDICESVGKICQEHFGYENELKFFK